MPVVRELSLRGARSHPVELPGHGLDAGLPAAYQAPQDEAAFVAAPSATAGLTLDDYARAVVDVVQAVGRHGPVVLVGHSLGGPIVTRAADIAPEAMTHLVYISAIATTPRGSALAAFAGPENAGTLALTIPPSGGDPTATGVTRTNLRSADPGFLSAYRDAVMGDVPEDRYLAALNFLQQPDESVLPTVEDVRADPTRWGSIPRTFIRLTGDRWHLPAFQDKIVADADLLTPDNRFTVRDLDSSHAGFVVTRPGELADLLMATTPETST
jgi:pimeloyl-ACP methyl ester carboxylesterase